MLTTDSPLVTDEQKAQFQEEGYFILERVIPDEMLQTLREQCAYTMGYMQRDAELHAGTGVNNQRGRHFIANKYHKSDRLRRFLFSPLMAEVTQAALGPNVYLFFEQWVVKDPQKGQAFSWHQDSGYVGHDNHKPYLTCWCALDEANEENGTVYLLPFSRAGVRHRVDHPINEQTDDRVGYTGDDPGIPAVVPAGSIVCFSSMLFHRSGANTSSRPRRAYLAQYSCEPLMDEKNELKWQMAVPFVRNGTIVYDPAADTAETAFRNSRRKPAE